MPRLGGGFFKFMRREHFRGYLYRGESRKEERGEEKGYLKRFFREYLWQYRWMLLATILVIGLNNSGPFIIAALNRVVVDRILVVTDGEGKPMMAPPEERRFQEGTAPHYRTPGRNPPRESMGRRMARGVRLNGRPAEAGKALLLLAILYILSQIFFNYLSRRADYLLVDFSMRVLGTLREDMHRKALALSLPDGKKIG